MITLKSIIQSHLKSEHYLQCDWLVRAWIVWATQCADNSDSKALCIQSYRAATNALMSSTIILPLNTMSSLCLLKESDAIISRLLRLCQSVSRLPDT